MFETIFKSFIFEIITTDIKAAWTKKKNKKKQQNKTNCFTKTFCNNITSIVLHLTRYCKKNS